MIAKLCEAKTLELREERHRFKRVLSIKDIRAAPMSNEQRAEARAKYEKWKAEIQQPDPLTVEEEKQAKKRAQETIAKNERRILEDYAARGIPPVRASDGTLISPSLVRQLGLRPPPKAEMDQ